MERISRNFLGLLLGIIIIITDSQHSSAAPMPRIGPMTIKGKIESITWYPIKFRNGLYTIRNGKRHYASGSLGHDRTIPAHYSIFLSGTTVHNEKGADPEYSFQSGTVIRIVINHPENDGLLKTGMRITIYGYSVDRDEGGDWYGYEKIGILHRKQDGNLKSGHGKLHNRL